MGAAESRPAAGQLTNDGMTNGGMRNDDFRPADTRHSSLNDSASGDSGGWHVPKRMDTSALSDRFADRGEMPYSQSSGAAPPTGNFVGPSRYERAGAAGSGNEFPGQHLPDAASSPASQRQIIGMPGAAMPMRQGFPQMQPSMMMPCFGGS
jgi:hypothetical protein